MICDQDVTQNNAADLLKKLNGNDQALKGFIEIINKYYSKIDMENYRSHVFIDENRQTLQREYEPFKLTNNLFVEIALNVIRDGKKNTLLELLENPNKNISGLFYKFVWDLLYIKSTNFSNSMVLNERNLYEEEIKELEKRGDLIDVIEKKREYKKVLEGMLSFMMGSYDGESVFIDCCFK